MAKIAPKIPEKIWGIHFKSPKQILHPSYVFLCVWQCLVEHTGILRPGLGRGRAGLSQSYSIASHHPKLVLYPGVQAHHSGCQHIPIDHLWHCKVKTKIRQLHNWAQIEP